MRQRVMIAIGLACNPKLIIADEPTTALDVTIQAQILELMKDLSRRLNIALIIITHNLGVVARYADRVNVMYAARIVEQGSADDIFLRPRHPYTHRPDALGAAARPAARRKLETIEGLPPDLLAPPAGCRFAPRCPFRIDVCEPGSAAAARSPPAHPSRLPARRRDRRPARSPGPQRAQTAAAAAAHDTGAPLLAVAGPAQTFRGQGAARALRRRPRRCGRSTTSRFDDRAGRDARPRRRIRLRQDHGRPHRS